MEVRPINLGRSYEYGALNIHLSAYDMALAESYAEYVHNLCNHLCIKVQESYTIPMETGEVLRPAGPRPKNVPGLSSFPL